MEFRYLVFSLAKLFLGELKGARRKRRDLRSKIAVLRQSQSDYHNNSLSVEN